MERKLAFQRVAVIISIISLLFGGSPVFAELNTDQLRATFEDNSILFSNNSEDTNCSSSAAQSASGAAGELVGEDNLKKAFNYFISKGAPKHIAAAIVGNFYQESRGNPILRQKTEKSDPNIMNSGGKYHPWTPDKPAGRGDAWGIAQWDPGVAALYWQQQAGVQGDITSLGVQLEIVWWQLQNKAPTSRPNVLKEMINYKELGGEYKDMDEISGATTVMAKRFMGAGIPMMPTRIKWARIAMSWEPDPSSAAAAASGAATNCSDNNGGGGGTISEGGLNEEQAKKFMMNYGENKNNESQKAMGGYLWNNCNGGGSNCVSFSVFFLNKFTSTKGVYTPGNGEAVVSYLRSNRRVPTGKTPKVGAIFSWNGGRYGHTGVVLGIHGDTVIVGQASCSGPGKGRGDGTQSGGGSGFIRVGKINETKAWLGRLPDEFAYPEVDMSAVASYVGASTGGGGGNVAL